MDKKKYSEWLRILEQENETIVRDDDGGRMLHSEGRYDELITKEEAFKYFSHCTMLMSPELIKRNFMPISKKVFAEEEGKS